MSHTHLFYFWSSIGYQKHSNDIFQYVSESYNNIIFTTLGVENDVLNRL